MPWHARLDLDYSRTGDRTEARFSHQGPLRILRSLHPEGPGICHNVIVHPPSGLVGGDMLDIRVHAAEGSHGLLTTPGATRFYRSEDEPARQHTRLRVDTGARLEWLPLEALCYSGCRAENRLMLDIAPGGELIGWDLSAFGLPTAQRPFAQGYLQQHLEWPGIWLERGLIGAQDGRMLDGPLGLAGRRCLASLFVATGTPLSRDRQERLRELAHALIDSVADGDTGLRAGVTSPRPHITVLRVLAPLVEPAHRLLRRVWSAWRQEVWQLPHDAPRIWNT